MTTKNLLNVHILSVGIFNGTPITSRDLSSAVTSFGKAGFKPVLKLGHSKKQTLLKEDSKENPNENKPTQKDGFPSAGIITALRKIGEKLFADIASIPITIANLIENRSFHAFSIEGLKNTVNQKGEKLPFVLTALALLGEDIPAVENLQDHLNLFSKAHLSGEPLVIEFSIERPQADNQGQKKQEDNTIMPDENVELKKKTDELEKQKKELGLAIESAEKLKKENEELRLSKQAKDEGIEEVKAELAKTNERFETVQRNFQVEKDLRLEAEKKGREEGVSIFLEKAVDDQKIFPAQKGLYRTVMLSLDDKEENVVFSKDGKDEKLTKLGAVKKIIAINTILLTKEQFQEGKEAPLKDDDGSARDEEVVEYIKKNNLSGSYADYKAAYVATEKEA